MSSPLQLIPPLAIGLAVPVLIGRAANFLAFLECLTVHIRNTNTKTACTHAATLFLRWCEERKPAIKPIHVAGYIEQLQGERLAPTVKQHLAYLRMFFDWLVTGRVISSNPAHSVRGPRYSLRKRQLLSSLS